jgi:tRNA threonylcarbamoyladenosine biosynthesis protein TsaB
VPETPPNYPLLILDTASANISIGLRISQSDTGTWYSSNEQAGKSIFRGIEYCLKKSRTQFKDISSILYCEGPGSMLGIRTTTMALRTWIHTVNSSLKIYKYRSLSLAAAELHLNNYPLPFTVILDARRSRWHTLTVANQDWREEIKYISSEDVSKIQNEIFLIEGFPTWAEISFSHQKCSYSPQLFSDHTLFQKLAHITISPNVFMTENPIYQKWDSTVKKPTKHPTKNG